MSEQLPSIDDFAEDLSELPSSEEFIKEDLPSVEDYIEKEEEDIVEETIEEPVVLEETTGDLTEILHLINAVRRDIPEIPEIKYYDEELEKISAYIEQVKEGIPEIPEVRYYDNEVEAICEQIDQVREEIKDLPEVKYYDEQVTNIEDRIDLLRQEVVNLPEVKYYDQEIEAICEQIDKVKAEIPTFPKWVNEVNEVPDFSWIGKTFSVIDDDFVKVDDNIKSIRDRIDQEVQEIAENLDIKDFENKLEFEKVTTNLKETKDKIYKELREAALGIYDAKKGYKDDDRKLKKQILSQYNKLSQNIDKQLLETKEEQDKSNNNFVAYFEGLKEEIANLPKPKDYDDPIKGLEKDLYTLDKKREDQGVNIAELYKIVGELKETQQELKEVYNDRPLTPDPHLKQGQDPLTPTDQKFATLQDLAANYRLFVNRVEQQLYTIGGGGAGFLKDLDDVNLAGLVNGNTIIWNATTSKWDAGTGVGAGGTWGVDEVGIHTTKNVAINATSAKEGYALWVGGKLGVSGDIEYDEATARNWNITGVATAAKMHVGAGTTWPEDLVVNGDARVIGILTIGTASIVIDGDNETINIGSEDAVRITNSSVTIGAGVTINATASGINSAPNVLYVAKDGQDTNNGTSIDNAFLTIKAAVGAASSGTTVKILSGRYEEANPIEVPAFVSLVGDDQRTVTVTPTTTTSDIFHVRKGTKLASMTFSGHLAPAAAVAFPTDEIAENVGGGKWKGPYIQNCTSDTTTGTGLYIDGDQARSLKAMNVDSYTQYNQGGVGVAITNGGFAQLVSLFTICCNEAVTADKGGQADIANSNCSFGSFGLVSRGVSDLQYTGIVTTTASASQAEVKVNVVTPTLNISNFVYDNVSGIATVTTSAAHGFQVGMGVTLAGIAVTCGAGRSEHTFVSGITSAITANNATKYTASTGTTYDPLTGVMVIGIGSHSLTTSNTITIDNGGLTFTCDADSNATEHAYPRATDPISGISTAITAVSATTITVNVSAVSGSTTKTYPYQKPYVFDVDSVPSTTSFSVNVGVSKHIHNYVSGGTAKIDVDRPYDGQLVYFDTLYKDVNKIAVGSGGTGYSFTPTVTVDAPTGPNGERATAFATLEGDSVASITIISSGSQYSGTPNITISAPEEGSNTATASATMEDLYYTINSSSPVSSGISTLTLATNLLSAVGVGSTAYFSQGSRIVASSHTFEYVGAGNLIVTATPKRGGVTNQENEVVTLTGGKVLYTSTDQAGNFRIGDDLQINQETGTISGRSFSKSLFSEMTPFILALS